MFNPKVLEAFNIIVKDIVTRRREDADAGNELTT